MRKSLFAIILCLNEVVYPQSPAASQPVAADVAAVFIHAGVDLSAVRIETPAAATFALIDAHNHLNANMSAEVLTQVMDRSGVASMVLMPRHFRSPSDGALANDEQALDYSQRYPGRFIPFVGGQRDDLGPRSIRDPRSVSFVLREFNDELSTGDYRGVGEFILVHHAYGVVEGGDTGGKSASRSITKQCGRLRRWPPSSVFPCYFMRRRRTSRPRKPQHYLPHI